MVWELSLDPQGRQRVGLEEESVVLLAQVVHALERVDVQVEAEVDQLWYVAQKHGASMGCGPVGGEVEFHCDVGQDEGDVEALDGDVVYDADTEALGDEVQDDDMGALCDVVLNDEGGVLRYDDHVVLDDAVLEHVPHGLVH